MPKKTYKPEEIIGKLYHGDTGNQLTNVAISRAKGKPVLVGDRDAFLSLKRGSLSGS